MIDHSVTSSSDKLRDLSPSNLDIFQDVVMGNVKIFLIEILFRSAY